VAGTTRTSDFLLLGLLSLIWGSSFILIKKGLVSFSPVQVVSLRLAITAIAFLPVFLMQIRRIPKKKYWPLLFIGFLGSYFPFFLYAVGQTEISSSIAGILNSLTPLFTLVIGIAFFRDPLRINKLIGVVLGLLGAGMLLVFSLNAGGQGNPLFGLFILAATICYGFAAHIVQQYLSDLNPLLISAGSFVLVGLPALFAVFMTDVPGVMAEDSHAWISLGYISLLAFFGTIIGTIMFFRLIHQAGAVFSSYVAYLMPVVAVFWGFLDAEHLGWNHLLGMILILYGIYIGRNRNRKRTLQIRS
jgi:drug/metabolite transporter (DMT)-like permease